MTSSKQPIDDISGINDLIDQFTNPILWVVTARSGQQPGGLIATFVSRDSLVPQMPRFIVGIANHYFTWKLIEESQAIAIHVVCQDQLRPLKKW